MKLIPKQLPPNNFCRYTRKAGATFDDLGRAANIEIKNELRKSLLVEQGYICCYCGRQISEVDSVIEHLKNKDDNPQLQLQYDNLLCSCKGGQDKRTLNPQYPLFCDAIKGKNEILVTPFNCECESKFEFDDEGNIIGIDEDARQTISVLNLDNVKLKHLRKHAIDAYRYLDDEFIDWEEELNDLNQKMMNKFKEFCFVSESYIRNYRIL